MKPKLGLICAYSENSRLIGAEGTLLWNIKEDKARFRELTMGEAILMGRRTYESIGKTLEGRLNIVLTRHKTLSRRLTATALLPKDSPLVFVSDFQEALHVAEISEVSSLFVAGGEEVYREALKMETLSFMYLTAVKEKLVPEGQHSSQAFFPNFNDEEWKVAEKEERDDFTFLTLYRK